MSSTILGIEQTEAGRGRVRDLLRHVHAVQSTIQREIGVAVVNYLDGICNWRPFRAHQKAVCGIYTC